MKKLLYILFLSVFPMLTSAQGKDWGRVSASLETTNHIYVDDQANNFLPTTGFDPSLSYLNGGRYASNNYLKVDYYKGRISTGLQLEGYFPNTVGYPYAQNKLTISNLYFSWTDDSYSVTAGSFYEQLGSGLLFRSWEDRALGLNNAILGARATYNYKEILSARVFAGVPRLGKLAVASEDKFFGLGLTNVAIAAADASVSISDVIGSDEFSFALEGSVLYRHETLTPMVTMLGCKENNVGWSARLNAETQGFYVKGEYVDAGMQYINPFFDAERGSAQLVEMGYNSKGLGVSLTGRRIHRMNQQIYTGDLSYSASANVVSYCPAMCTQYTYMLTTLVPYSPVVGTNGLIAGEVGGQIDAFYNFRRGTKLGGKRGMKVHANFSTYYSLDRDGGVKDSELLFRDFSFDVEKQWTKKFKTTLLYSLQEYNDKEIDYTGVPVYVGMSHTVVADLLYKWTPKFSTRLELQYLASKGYQKDWMAALLEVSFAPHWKNWVACRWAVSAVSSALAMPPSNGNSFLKWWRACVPLFVTLRWTKPVCSSSSNARPSWVNTSVAVP